MPRGGQKGYSENTVYQFGTRGILNPAKAKLDTYDELKDNINKTHQVVVNSECPVRLEHVRIVIDEALNVKKTDKIEEEEIK